MSRRVLFGLLLGFAPILHAQYAASASGSTTGAAEINGKINHQEYAGNPDGILSCTVGKDLATDTTTGDVYRCKTTGTAWVRVHSGGYVTYTTSTTGVAADCGRWVKMNGSSITYTLPSPPPYPQCNFTIQNIAASDLTIGRNSLTINGGTSNITLKQYSVVVVYTDGTNYMSTVPLVAGSNITLTPGVTGLTIASSGGAGTGCIPAGSTGQLLLDSGSGTCTSVTALPTASVPAFTGDVTNSAGSLAFTIAANAVGSSKMAVVNTRRVCDIPVGDTSGSALTDAQLGPQKRLCYIPYAATIVEMTVAADAGTPNVIVSKNHAGTVTNIVSAALATAASGGIACSNTGGTTGLDAATTCSATLQNTSVAAGDYLGLVSGTAGGTAKLLTVHVVYTVN